MLGHATSADLLHWEEQPVALRPGDGDDGCWSGCVVVGDDGAPQLLYTSIQSADLDRGVVRVAHPEDGDWSSWRKGEVLVSPPRAGTAVFRDPAVFRDGDDWVMLVGCGGEDRTAGAEAFVSRDLITWEHRGLVATRTTDAEGLWTGDAWECPQLLRLPHGIDVLVVSVWSAQVTRYVAATRGTYANGGFREGTWQQLTFGPGHYAASGFTDRDGRSCVVFWIRGVARPGAWSGCISLPYVIGVDGGLIRLALHPSVAAARLAAGGAGGAADRTALDVEWTTTTGAGCLRLVDRDGREEARLDLRDSRLAVAVRGVPEHVHVPHHGALVRLVADGPVLEVVADGGIVGLPLAASGALHPESDVPGSFAWWQLA